MAADKEQILIVDDAPDTREVLQRNLQSEGYRVFTASDVPNAITILTSNTASSAFCSTLLRSSLIPFKSSCVSFVFSSSVIAVSFLFVSF